MNQWKEPRGLMKARNARNVSGVALILVLCVLVLLSALIVGFFSTIRNERVLSKNYEITSETRQLADSAVNIVMAQIQDATTQSGLTWTSQPGMVRTFGTDSKQVRAYKLYSSGQMTVDGAFNAQASRKLEIPDDWQTRKGEFIDLNAPVMKRYPIIDPSAANLVEPHGFQPDDRDGVAMPVRWIYVLSDGTLAGATYLASGSVSVNGAKRDNPITGRIAFWTDDETCKVDINTASEGVFWDTPRTQTAEDQLLSSNQPVQYEFQRFPGHPATVCLSSIFPGLVDSSSTLHNSKIYALTPRTGTGGSREGTTQTALLNFPLMSVPVSRLYASLDEMLYTVTRSANLGITSDQINQSRFFLTENSRSPDLNLFNMPRVCLWPIHADPARRSITDKLIAFCSTIPAAKKGVLYFTRQDPRDKSNDYANDSNNGTLYQYLQKLTSQPVPGFGGGTFEMKYGLVAGVSERDQILTEIYDYIRCTNLMASGATPGSSDNYTSSNYKGGAGNGQVLPIEIGTTRGFGRFPTISEAAIQFRATASNSQKQITTMSATLLLSTSTPAQGYTAINRNYSHAVTTTATFSIKIPSSANNQNFCFAGENIFPVNTLSTTYQPNDSPLGGDEGFAYTLYNKTATTSVTATNASKIYPLVYTGLTVSGTVFSFGGGDVQVLIRAPSATNSAVTVQTLSIHFPPVSNLPAPRVPTGSAWKNPDDPDYFTFDTVRSVQFTQGDMRLLAAMGTVPDTSFAPADLPGYQSSATNSFGLRTGTGQYYTGATYGSLIAAAYSPQYRPNVPASVVSATIESANSTAMAGDWDNGLGFLPDGAYINKPDEGCMLNSPYYNAFPDVISAQAFFTQRQVASPVMLGSLPTGVVHGQPWQTLLFCPNPAAGAGHPGFQSPADYLLLDLFTMPVVEPYALSEPLSASGRINLNHELVPFTGMTRTTGLRAVLKSTRIMAIPTSDAGVYKQVSTVSSPYRYAIDADETLKLIDRRFAAGDVYRSPAEICNIFLVPKNAPGGPTSSVIEDWWQDYKLTGDNVREMPYNHLYPLLTTQSNCYRIHFRVQSLTKTIDSDPAVWNENHDVISGEYRGATVIERRIDPGDSRLANVDVFSQSLTPYYRYRIIGTVPF